jgi:hypothetical protein
MIMGITLAYTNIIARGTDIPDASPLSGRDKGAEFSAEVAKEPRAATVRSR